MNDQDSSLYEEYYRILLLKPGSSKEEIAKAWRSEIQIHHPDRYPARLKRKAEERTQRLNVAKDKLLGYWDRFGIAPPDRLSSAETRFQKELDFVKNQYEGKLAALRNEYERNLDLLRQELATERNKTAYRQPHVSIGGSISAPSLANINTYIREHNTFRRGAKGMIISVTFDIRNAVGIDICLKVSFYFLNMSEVKAIQRGEYSDVGGNLAAFIELEKPRYPAMTFTVDEVFVPYVEFALSMGRKTDLQYKTHVLIGKHAQPSLNVIGESNPVAFFIDRSG